MHAYSRPCSFDGFAIGDIGFGMFVGCYDKCFDLSTIYWCKLDDNGWKDKVWVPYYWKLPLMLIGYMRRWGIWLEDGGTPLNKSWGWSESFKNKNCHPFEL